MNAISRSSRQEDLVTGVVGGGHAVASGREGLVDGDLDGREFGVGHAGEVEELEGGVDYGYVEVWCTWSALGGTDAMRMD